MNRHKIAGLLGDMARICRELETEVLGPTDAPSAPNARPHVAELGGGKGPTSWIKSLVAGGFFATSRTDLEVQRELKRRAHGCGRVAVAVALARLVSKDVLTRVGEGTAKSPYRYSKPS